MAQHLPDGIYEKLLTDDVACSLRLLPADRESTLSAGIDDADLPHVLSRHMAARLEQVLAALPTRRDRLAFATHVATLLSLDEDAVSEEDGPRLLTEVRPRAQAPKARPSTPLNDVALFTNGPSDPQLAAELRLEMASADRIDLLCAFVQWSGIRLLEGALQHARDRGVPLRVLTTTYIGATDRKALDHLVRSYGAEVRVNFDAQSTHLHAKAWYFHRNSGFSTAYVGSSNMSRAALLDGLEWNVRVSQTSTPGLLHKFTATFESYWDSPAFQSYDPDTDADYLDAMLIKHGGRGGASVTEISRLDVRPYPHQAIMLEELAAEREVHDRHRNLLVAATGTGKTVIAALDYKRLASVMGGAPRLLFLAHRKEILEQALRTFREVMGSGAFGELFVDGARPVERRHVFASVQSMARREELEAWAPHHFDIIVVDEFHHAEADSYRRLLNHFTPRELLGLTATPERADGRADLSLELFDGRIASELRLWDALSADILVPFHYFGIADDVSLEGLRFQRGRYDVTELEKIYTGNDARVRKILTAVSDKVTDPHRMRALGFCVSVAHARYMADRFTAAGIPSLALDGSSGREERRQGLEKLRDGRVNCIFAVDLFNEGLDIPHIDTVLMLRPTQSATIFLQQLGRGLRRAEGKAVLTVLDFVGMQNKQFRFDLKYRALTGLSRTRLVSSIEKGFPFLPPGSQIIFDRVAQDIVLRNVKSQLTLSTRDLVVDVRQHLPQGVEPSDYTLGMYLSAADRAIADIYGFRSSRTFQTEKRPSTWRTFVDWAFPTARQPLNDEDQEILRRVQSLTHCDDEERLSAYRQLLTARSLPEHIESNLFAAMLYFSIWPSGYTGGMRAGLERLRSHQTVLAELLGVFDVLSDRSRVRAKLLAGRLAATPLRSHARYSREELLAGLGLGTLDPGTPGAIREGVKWLPGLQTDALLVTLKKSEADYSPTTMYRDYALAPDLFHWESQSTTSAESPTGLRYVNHAANGTHVVLFVRRAKTGDLGTEPYTCLGTAQFVKAEGSKPMQIIWKLDRGMPAELLVDARAVA